MNINQISNPNFLANTKFIPLSKYKGPILQLTESDKLKIKQLREQIAQLEIRLYDMKKHTNLNRHINSDILNYMGFLEFSIDSLQAEIRQIKKDRLEQQKKQCKSS